MPPPAESNPGNGSLELICSSLPARTGELALADTYLQVTTTTESRTHAQALARTIVQARLAACVQVLGPIESTFWWNDEVQAAEEWMCLMKTTAGRYPALEELIRAHHTYEVPEITASPIAQGSDEYLQWIGRETKSPSG